MACVHKADAVAQKQDRCLGEAMRAESELRVIWLETFSRKVMVFIKLEFRQCRQSMWKKLSL